MSEKILTIGEVGKKVARWKRGAKKNDPDVNKLGEMLGEMTPVEKKMWSNTPWGEKGQELRERLKNRKAQEKAQPSVDAAMEGVSSVFGGAKRREPQPYIAGAGFADLSVPDPRYTPSYKPPKKKEAPAVRASVPEENRKAIESAVLKLVRDGKIDMGQAGEAVRKAMNMVRPALSVFTPTARGQEKFFNRMVGKGEAVVGPGGAAKKDTSKEGVSDYLKQAFLELKRKPERTLMGAAKEMLEKTGFGLLLNQDTPEDSDALLMSTAEGILNDFRTGRYDKEYSEDVKKIVGPYLERAGGYRIAADKTIEDESRAELEGRLVDRGPVDVPRDEGGSLGAALKGFYGLGPLGAIAGATTGFSPIGDAIEGVGRGVYRALPTGLTQFRPGYFDRSDLSGSAAFINALEADKRRITKLSKDSVPKRFVENIGEMAVGLLQLVWEGYGLMADDVPGVVREAVIADMRNRGVLRPITAQEYTLMARGNRADKVRNMLQAMGASLTNVAKDPVTAFQADPLFTLMTITGAARAVKMAPGVKSRLQKSEVVAPDKSWVPKEMRGKKVSRYDLITSVLNQVDTAMVATPIKLAAKALPYSSLYGPALQQVGAALAPVGKAYRGARDFFIRPTGPFYRVINELEAVADVSPVYREQIEKLRKSVSGDMKPALVLKEMDRILAGPLKEAYAEVMLRELGLKDAAARAERAGRSLFETLKAEQAMKLGDELPARGPEAARGEPFPAPRATPDPFAPAKKAAEESVVASALREVRRLAETLEERFKDPSDTLNATRRDRAFEQGISDLVKEDIKVRVDEQVGTLLEKEARLKNELVSYVEGVKQKIQREGGSLEGEFTQALNAAAEQKGWPEVLRMLKGGDDPLGGSFARSVAKRRGQKALNLEDPPAPVPGQEPPVATPLPAVVSRDVSPVAPAAPEAPVAAPVPDTPVLPTPEAPTPAAPVVAPADVSPTPGARLADEGYFENLIRLEDDADVARPTSETVPLLEEGYNNFVRGLAETKGDAPHVFVLEASDATSGLLESLKDTLRGLVIKDLEPTIKSESQRRRMNMEYVEKLVEKDMGEARAALYREVLDADGNLQFIEGTGHSKPGKPRFDPGRPKVDTEVISQSDLPVLILEDGQIRAPGLHTSNYGMRIKRATGKVDDGITGERQAIAHVIAGLESGKPFKVAASSADTARYLESLSVPKSGVPGLGTVMGSDGLIGSLMQGQRRILEAAEAGKKFIFGDRQSVRVAPEVSELIKNPDTRGRGLGRLIEETDVAAGAMVTRERRALLDREIKNSAGAIASLEAPTPLRPGKGTDIENLTTIREKYAGEVTAATDATLAGRSAEEFGLKPATPEQKKWLGVDEGRNVYIQPQVQSVIGWDIKWRKLFGEGAGGSFILKKASSLWKMMMTATNPVTFAGNFISNLALRAMVDGAVSPIGLFEATGTYNKYKKGTLQKELVSARKSNNADLVSKLEFEIQMMKEWEKRGWGDFTAVEVQKALGKRITDKFGKWIGESATSDIAGAVSRIMQGTATKADNVAVRGASGALDLWKSALGKMQSAYQVSDVWFKLERGLLIGRLLDKGLAKMKTGKKISFDVSPERGVTIYKSGDKSFRLNGENGRRLTMKEVRSLISEAGRLAGNRLYFDYSKVSGWNKFLRESGADMFVSPFYSWFWKAMWIPGMKEGLGKHILTGGLSGLKSTDPAVTRMLGTARAEQARGRLGVVLSSSMSRQLPESDKETIKMFSGYGKTKDTPFMGLLSKGEGGMHRFMMNRFEVSGGQLPAFRILGDFTSYLRGKDPGGSALDGRSVDFGVKGTPHYQALNAILRQRARNLSLKEDAKESTEKKSRAIRDLWGDPDERMRLARIVRASLPSAGSNVKDLTTILGLQPGGAGPLIVTTTKKANLWAAAQLIGLVTGSKIVGDLATKALDEGGSIKSALAEHVGYRFDRYSRGDLKKANDFLSRNVSSFAKEWKDALKKDPIVPRTEDGLTALQEDESRRREVYNLKIGYLVDAEMDLLKQNIRRELVDLGFEPYTTGGAGLAVRKRSAGEREREALKEIEARRKRRTKEAKAAAKAAKRRSRASR